MLDASKSAATRQGKKMWRRLRPDYAAATVFVPTGVVSSVSNRAMKMIERMVNRKFSRRNGKSSMNTNFFVAKEKRRFGARYASLQQIVVAEMF